ncbi:class I SAM-dependent methyltransferase [Shimia sp. FJ5]|uniref:class I SAM-dependent methyltransferase n=1 Tax=Shimia sp. FJ5 TaxID=3079054 RepID=UPI0026325461|nr:methyltransferase domain-containing protein [Shimia sp. FJ5]MDV4145596.1 methyltransferase domain-containing protein [Shimia sp. FJ5]
MARPHRSSREPEVPSLNRIVMAKSSRRMIRALDPERLDAAEISGRWGEQFGFRSYERFIYPEFDICAGPFPRPDGKPRKFDLIIANQVWEHLDRPYAATKNVRRMLRKGGHFWVAVPFHIPFHAAPLDNSRWSARGLKNLLIESGFAEDEIQAEQWGNRPAAARNLELPWPPMYDEGRDTLENDPEMPICAWAIARRT